MRLVAGITLAATLAVLTGCAASTEPAAPSPEPTSAPVFASEEEALAAAEDAYKAYLKVYDQVLNDGGEGAERLSEILTGKALEDAAAGAAEFRADDMRITGTRRIDALHLQSVDHDGATFYACEDVSDVGVWDSNGESLVAPDRPPTTPFEVRLVKAREGELRISERTVWPGAGVCEG
jgi:hypothetical protein